MSHATWNGLWSLELPAAHPSVRAVASALLSRGSAAGSHIAVLAGCASWGGGGWSRAARGAAGVGSDVCSRAVHCSIPCAADDAMRRLYTAGSQHVHVDEAGEVSKRDPDAVLE